MNHFSLRLIHLWTTKRVSLYARLTPHAVKLINHFWLLTNRYFRRLGKELTIFLPIFLLVLIGINFKVPKNSFESFKEIVQLNPKNSKAHILLAEKFISTNQYSFAQNELYDAIINSQSKKESTGYFEELEKIGTLKNRPSQIRSQVLLWQKITNQNPKYRDGYIKLAILNWKLYRPFDASKDLTLAKETDPNNADLKKFEDSLK